MKNYELIVKVEYRKRVEAESHDDALLIAEEAVLDDFYEWECTDIWEDVDELQPRCDEGDAPPRGIV